MPTGYTIPIYEGKNITVEEYILTCSRAFGAVFHQRDEVLSANIKPYEPDLSYDLGSIRNAEERYAEMMSTPIEELESYLETKYQTEIEEWNEKITHSKNLEQRYDSMIEQVNQWIPPTKDHENLKQFAIEQIQSSKQYDVNYEYYEKYKPTKESVEEYIENTRERFFKDLKYHTESINSKLKHAQEKNEWIQALKDSLKSLEV